MVKAKERTKQAYKDSIERIVTNIRMYLDVLRPRNFDAGDLTTEVPGDLAFYFCYNQFEANSSEVGKVLIKDIKGLSSWASLAQAQRNLGYLFKLLKNHLLMNTTLPRV